MVDLEEVDSGEEVLGEADLEAIVEEVWGIEAGGDPTIGEVAGGVGHGDMDIIDIHTEDIIMIAMMTHVIIGQEKLSMFTKDHHTGGVDKNGRQKKQLQSQKKKEPLMIKVRNIGKYLTRQIEN